MTAVRRTFDIASPRNLQTRHLQDLALSQLFVVVLGLGALALRFP